MDQTLFYNTINATYRSNAKVEVDRYCNGFTVVNTGATVMQVNGVPLSPAVAPNSLGESVTFGGNRNEIYYGRIDIQFAAGVSSCVVIQKVYIKFSDGEKPVNL